VVAALLLAAVAGCDRSSPAHSADPEGDLAQVRVALGASFTGAGGGGLRDLLDSDPIVQPPEPDSAVRGAEAAAYLERLARHTQVSYSELRPTAISQEGDFLLERGTWFLESDRTFRSRYTIRWRETPAGWKVVLWRWTSFR
jgi:hypothetical protein